MTIGVRHDDLRRKNRAMVIAAVRRAGQPSRTEIAAVTGLSNSTISTIAADLIEEGILAEVRSGETIAAKRGRPQVALGLNPRAATVVSVVLSLNSLSASLIDYSGRAIAHDISRPPTLTMNEGDLVEAVTASVRRLLARVQPEHGPLLRMTLAVQGITDSDARKLLWSPITPHSDIAFADALEAIFTIPVTVENDCNMIAVALRSRAPERYSDNFFTILLSNGIGMGLVLRGELFTGSHSSGGEFGHMVHIPDGAQCRCGRRGCIEAYAGNYAILRHARGESERAQPAADIDDATMLALAAAARDHEGREREAFQKAGEAIGFGLGSLFALFDPAPVAIVGLGTSAFDVIEPAMRDAISRTAGGQHNAAISFDLEPDEMPLIRDGCARQALAHVDLEIFAAGVLTTTIAGKEVA
ncbi:ROK family transcriptional regulator [Mesorhizobium microcysteis]|uniref:ROK family transcriptional regulator n=1 Tax=Neoaquamicrobium microcysteis TaxID=2682781 RepID=A0A5D4H1X7_9HYPH|nr:ROK family transcriptional regulator [Mesorhizobium microcysteis]TYR34866.1 ROK family transcriptional regulator [Mesorhizobium microcysteis]